MATVVEQLNNAPAWENPAYNLALQIQAMQEAGASWEDVLKMDEQISAAIDAGRNEERKLEAAFRSLLESEAVTSNNVPVGF